jgi:hypothetical protein
MKELVSKALKMEQTCSSEMSVDFNRLHSIVSQKIELFITTAVTTSHLTPRNKIVFFVDVMPCTTVSEEPAASISVAEDSSILKMEAAVSSGISVYFDQTMFGLTFQKIPVLIFSTLRIRDLTE